MMRLSKYNFQLQDKRTIKERRRRRTRMDNKCIWTVHFYCLFIITMIIISGNFWLLAVVERKSSRKGAKCNLHASIRSQFVATCKRESEVLIGFASQSMVYAQHGMRIRWGEGGWGCGKGSNWNAYFREWIHINGEVNELFPYTLSIIVWVY